MDKYNLLMAEETDNYTLNDDIEYLKNENNDKFEKIYENFHKKVMDYLEEENPSNIIMICDDGGMENQEDFDEFCKKYCPLNNPDYLEQKPFTDEWFSSFKDKNKDGEKYIWATTGSDKIWVVIFTKDFLNKYINKKGE